SLMRGVVERGTAASLNQYGLGYVAGKTGTTSNYRDAWFVGYVPDLLTAVWVGFDDGTPLRMSSGEAAVPIWATFMTRAPHRQSEIQAPQGVTIVEVEAATGRVWQPGCGPSVTEAFLSGTEPREPCGGYFDGSQVLSIYEEPGMMSEEMAAALAAADSSMNRVEIVDDPDMAEIQEADTAIEEQIDTVLTKPPVVQPPVVQPPVIAPPPPRDTLKDSLLIR
ncbi:MAG TPA: penicillin-binding transpeptidase domain-containing protein, partial [Gemmatimonadaceae bacterium]|nr:penicillin-binding transpeptidase domain-containing protein [Gemmatimonadaceae bacterium]